MLKKLSRNFRIWREVPLAIGAGFSAVMARLDDLAIKFVPKPEPGPFVAVLIEAERPGIDGKAVPTSFGLNGRLTRESLDLREQAMVPLRNGRVIVFCDLEKVDVHGVFIGNNFMHCAVGSCPIAYFETCELGHVISVQVRRR